MKRQRIAPSQLALPAPDPGVVELSRRFLKPNSRILDLGCGIGRNAIHLASVGHEVVGIDQSAEYIGEARKYARTLGSSALRLSFEARDLMTYAPRKASFDAVFITRVLQEMTEKESCKKTITVAQNATRQRGFNFVTAYIGSLHEQNVKDNLTILFPDELEGFYTNAGWSVAHKHQHIQPLKRHGAEVILGSYDEIVAQKPAAPFSAHPPGSNVQLGLEHLKIIDPEFYDGLQGHSVAA